MNAVPTTEVLARLALWLVEGEAGRSSLAIARALTYGAPGLVTGGAPSAPSDLSDLSNCLRLIQSVPEARSGVTLLGQAAHGETWAELDAVWETLSAQGERGGLCSRQWPWPQGREEDRVRCRATLQGARMRGDETRRASRLAGVH